VEKPRAKEGYTRVFVPLNPTVQKFFNELSSRFLHFSDKETKTVLEKTNGGQARIYRKGVFVRELESWNNKSLFDYNFGDELEIDECRNANDWDCKRQIGKVLSTNVDMLSMMFRRFINGVSETMLEDTLSQYHITPNDQWGTMWTNIADEKTVVVSQSQLNITEFLTKKGLKVCIVPDTWYKSMATVKEIKKGTDCLNKLENRGCNVIEPTEKAKIILDEVWGWLVDINMTNKKKKPNIKCFSRVIENGESILFGYCEGDTIFINSDYDDNKQTYLEEIAHYITEATDGTREFQEFAFQIGTRMASVLYS
jgi:hypothetical protein